MRKIKLFLEFDEKIRRDFKCGFLMELAVMAFSFWEKPAILDP